MNQPVFWAIRFQNFQKKPLRNFENFVQILTLDLAPMGGSAFFLFLEGRLSPPPKPNEKALKEKNGRERLLSHLKMGNIPTDFSATCNIFPHFCRTFENLKVQTNLQVKKNCKLKKIKSKKIFKKYILYSDLHLWDL